MSGFKLFGKKGVITERGTYSAWPKVSKHYEQRSTCEKAIIQRIMDFQQCSINSANKKYDLLYHEDWFAFGNVDLNTENLKYFEDRLANMDSVMHYKGKAQTCLYQQHPRIEKGHTPVALFYQREGNFSGFSEEMMEDVVSTLREEDGFTQKEATLGCTSLHPDEIRSYLNPRGDFIAYFKIRIPKLKLWMQAEAKGAQIFENAPKIRTVTATSVGAQTDTEEPPTPMKRILNALRPSTSKNEGSGNTPKRQK